MRCLCVIGTDRRRPGRNLSSSIGVSLGISAKEIADHEFLFASIGIEITELGGSEEDENLTPHTRKRTKKKSTVPVWQKSQELAKYAMLHSDDYTSNN